MISIAHTLVFAAADIVEECKKNIFHVLRFTFPKSISFDVRKLVSGGKLVGKKFKKIWIKLGAKIFLKVFIIFRLFFGVYGKIYLVASDLPLIGKN